MGSTGRSRAGAEMPLVEAMGDERPTDASFDRFARLVRRVLDCPVSTVTIVEDERQVFVGADGLGPRLDHERETPLSHSFCRHVADDERALVVADAREHPRLRHNPSIEEHDVIAYAGWPLRDHRDRVIGSLCAIDHRPREWSDREVALLADLAAACSAEIAQRALRAEAVRGEAEARGLSARSGVLLALSEGLSGTHTIADVAAAVGAIAHERLGCLRAGVWLRDAGPDASQALPATADAPVESLSWVDPGDERWESARQHAVLPLTLGNPLGRSLLRRTPMFLASRDDQGVLFPHLSNASQIGEARAFVPLTVRGHAYGVLVLVWEGGDAVTDDDRVTIAALASYTAQAVQRAVLVQERLDAMGTLQSSMMTRLPRVPGLTLAARYLPAASRDQVGGDWYDAVAAPHDVSLVVGDVVGHDIEAAATMGQLRSMLRTLAWNTDESPSHTIGRLDLAMHDLGVEELATLLFARLAPPPEDRPERAWTLRWATAGHPAPLVLGPDGVATWLEGRADLMLGVRPDTQRWDHEALLLPGSTVLLCTDGLFERRGEDLGAGLERLRVAVERHGEQPLEALLDAVRDDLVGPRHADDVALMAARLDG